MSSSSKIILKKSSVENKIPQTSDLEFGELALNFADGKLYFKNSDEEIDAFLSGTSDETAIETKVPFFLADGTRSDIPVALNNTLPFFLADGSQNNIPLTA